MFSENPDIKFRYRSTLDFQLVSDWVRQDPIHSANGLNAGFFMDARMFGYVIEDEIGPIMFVRMDAEFPRTIRAYVQFAPNERKRTAKALIKVMPTVCETLANAGVQKLVFDSISTSLIKFCEKRFGFKADTNNDYYLELGT